MNANEHNADWQQAFQERLGLLCGDGVPTRAQEAQARRAADEYIGQEVANAEILAGLERVRILAAERRREHGRRKYGQRDVRAPYSDA